MTSVSQLNSDSARVVATADSVRVRLRAVGLSGAAIATAAAEAAQEAAAQAESIVGIGNAGARSVKGNATDSSGATADITAGTDHQVLRRSGSTLGFGAISLDQSAAVTGSLPVANGGTGAATASAARTNLGHDTNQSLGWTSASNDKFSSQLAVRSAIDDAPDVVTFPVRAEFMVDAAEGTIFGDFTSSSLAFNGDTSVTAGNCAQNVIGGSGAATAYIGKSFNDRKVFTKAIVYGSTNNGFFNGTTTTLTINVYGKDDDALDATGDLLGTTGSFTDLADESAGRTITLTQARGYNYIAVEFVRPSGNGSALAAEVQFFERKAFGIGRTAADRAWDSIHLVDLQDVVADGTTDGGEGTDYTTELADAFAEAAQEGFGRIILPRGVVCWNSPVLIHPYLAYDGQGKTRANTPTLEDAGGTFLFYRGTGAAFYSPTTAAFPFAKFSNFGMGCSLLSTVDDPASGCTYFFDLTTPRNCEFNSLFLVNQNTGLVDGVNGGGAIRTTTARDTTEGSTKDDLLYGQSWSNNMTDTVIQCDIDRNTNFGGEANYEGYAYALLSDATDWKLTASESQGGTVRLKHGAGFHFANVKLENAGAGSLSPGESSIRACLILQNDDLENGNDNSGISGEMAGGEITQGGTGVIIDATAQVGEVGVSFAGVRFRRNWHYDFDLRAHADGANGLTVVGCSFLGHELGTAPQEPRVTKSTGLWYGERFVGNVRQIPDEEIEHRETVCEWSPIWGSSSIEVRGVAAPTVVGTASSASFSGSALGQIKRTVITSGSSASDAAALIGAAAVCWRGNAAGLGGFLVWQRFALPTMVATSRGFFGLRGTTTAIGDNEPSSLTQSIGFGFDEGGTDWKLIRAGASAIDALDLGTFEVNATDIFDVMFLARPNSAKIKSRIENVTTGEWLFIETVRALPTQGNTSPQIISDPDGATPSATSTLVPHLWHSNGSAATGTASAVVLHFHGMKVKTMHPGYCGA